MNNKNNNDLSALTIVKHFSGGMCEKKKKKSQKAALLSVNIPT